MNSLSLALSDLPPGVVVIITAIYIFMAYSLVKRLWPGVHARLLKLIVWAHIHTPGWEMSVCKIRALEPVGPDVACYDVCQFCEPCWEWVDNLGL